MTPFISCEHGGNKIPKKYAFLFNHNKKMLDSHNGWDNGALILARKLAHDLNAMLFYSETSRLLIDLNRSLHHTGLFSEFSRSCNKKTKQEIIKKFYYPYRSEVENKIKIAQVKSPVLHFSVHSFTPIFNNEIRNADIGLLYDPARKPEKEFCRKLQTSLKEEFPNLTIRCNYPYRGSADGFTSYLRKKFNERKYVGIEIEVNQKHIIACNQSWSIIKQKLGKNILALLN